MILTTRVWIEARLKIAAKPFTGSRRSDNDDGDWHGDENDRFKGISGHVFFERKNSCLNIDHCWKMMKARST